MCSGTLPQWTLVTSFKALLIAKTALLDFGDRAISITILASGILASGSPNLSTAFIVASNLGPILGLASPISS